MQIVIDIPDEIYETLKNNGVIVNGLRCGKTFLSEVFAAIANGTPLPKGHGRLIDGDELKTLCYEVLVEEESFSGVDEVSPYNGITEEDIDLAPTIIEADKG